MNFFRRQVKRFFSNGGTLKSYINARPKYSTQWGRSKYWIEVFSEKDADGNITFAFKTLAMNYGDAAIFNEGHYYSTPEEAFDEITRQVHEASDIFPAEKIVARKEGSNSKKKYDYFEWDFEEKLWRKVSGDDYFLI